jgi:beta-glucosidase
MKQDSIGMAMAAAVAMLLATVGIASTPARHADTARARGDQQTTQEKLARPSQAQVKAQVDALLARMTLREKIRMLGGVHGFYTAAIPRLGIPALRMSDGPMGLRNQEPSTAFPAGITLAATWDTRLARRMGQAMGLEARARGVNILLAPGVNIQRVAVDGRNFEFYGEDPYLAGQIAASFVRGVQSEGVIATVKHFVANNQETDRQSIDEIISERALHEIYLPAFKAAIEQGHAWAVMAAYNKVNGSHAAENKALLTGILKKRWGFRGFVMSDWGAAHKGVKAALAGLDLEMPSPRYMNVATLLPAIRSGKIPVSMINDKVRRILRAAISMNFFRRPQLEPDLSRYSGASSLVALQGAREGIVLLRNQDHLLPLDPSRIHSIAVFGPNANPAVTGGGGSSHVVPFRATSVLEGLVEMSEPRIRVDYMPFPPIQEPATGGPYAAEQKLGAKDDVAVVCVGFNPKTESEGFDRTFTLPAGQDQLIEAVAQANPRTIVVLNSGGAVAMTGWIHKVGALLEAWYPGQEGGRAVAEILFGKGNPSGKLPATFEKKWGDAEAEHYYPGHDGKVIYKEGIFVGYRWFQHAGIKPLFPFGFGLSYSTFAFSGLSVRRQGSTVSVAFQVKNTSNRAGAEVAQVYVQEVNPPVPMPVEQLKGFARVELAPGATRTVHILLPRSAFADYDTAIHGWKVTPGRYNILVGSSSADIRLRAPVTLR